MYNFILALVCILFPLSVYAQQTLPTTILNSGINNIGANITSQQVAGVYYVGPASANNVIELKRGAALAGTLYHCAVIAADVPPSDGVVDTAAKCTSITSLSTDTVVTVTNPSRYFVIDIDTAETGTNISYLTIRGSASAGVPSLSGPNNLTSLSTTREGGTLGIAALPSPTRFGHGIDMEGTPGFTAAKYPGGPAGEGSEPNNMMGWYYNKRGVLASGIAATIDLWEPSFDYSWELGYRKSDPLGTTDETWWELNWDIWPADFTTTTIGGVAGTFVAGDRASCSGGGSLYVVAYPSANNLTFRQDWGRCLAGEVVTNQTAGRIGNTATLGTLTPIQTNYFRPYIHVYRHLQNTAAFEFDTLPSAGTTFSISANYARMNGNIVVSGTGSSVYGPAYWAVSDGGSNNEGNEICSQGGAGVFTCQSVINFNNFSTAPTSALCNAPITATHTFIAMCK